MLGTLTLHYWYLQLCSDSHPTISIPPTRNIQYAKTHCKKQRTLVVPDIFSCPILPPVPESDSPLILEVASHATERTWQPFFLLI